ncbi:DUF84 family protein [Salipaludibacillus sp. CF4.18]|uniref:DUF84 family protein n=1 Tax=Salipaludibacillus sp. CF4.18 TaxID=3373081 RepID=UPI003EE69D2A
MKQIVYIGTMNQAKIKAVEAVFSEGYEIRCCDAPSGVSGQPYSDEETRTGAVNRAKYSVKELDAGFGIGLEGGIMKIETRMYLCNWGALVTNDGKVFEAAGARVPLPESVEKMLDGNLELGEVMDIWTNEKGIRHREGAIGNFTNGLVSRAEMFEHITKMLYGQMIIE